MTRMIAGATVSIALLAGTPAWAAVRTWIASTGSDSSADCSFNAPCKSVSTAYDKTGAGGEINCKDSVALGGIASISHSITINCEGGMSANADPAGTSNVGLLNINIGVNDTVVLRGLNLDFAGVARGINFNGAGTLVVDQVFVTNANKGGIDFEPNGPAKLIVSDSAFTTNGTGSMGAGILISPAPGGTAQVAINRASVSKNAFGIAVDGSNSTGGINMTIADSMIASSVSDGLVATTSSGHAPIGVMVTNTKSVNNAIGIRSLGPNVTVRVRNSDVIGNGTGLRFGDGGALLTAGTNMVRANAADGTFSGPVALQ